MPNRNSLSTNASLAGREIAEIGRPLGNAAVQDPSEQLSVATHGADGDCILKFPLEGHPRLAENEFALMELAWRIGIDVPNTRLLPLGKIDGLPDEMPINRENAFATKRFYRPRDGMHIHMKDFAQVFGMFADRKYEKRNCAHIEAMARNMRLH